MFILWCTTSLGNSHIGVHGYSDMLDVGGIVDSSRANVYAICSKGKPPLFVHNWFTGISRQQ